MQFQSLSPCATFKRAGSTLGAALFAVAGTWAIAWAGEFQTTASGSAQEARTGEAQAPAAPALQLTPIDVSAAAVSRALAAVGVTAEAPAPIAFSVPELRRQLVYQFGSQALDSRKIDVFIDQEMQHQIEAGADRSRFDIAEAVVQQKVNEAIESVKQQYPTMDPKVVLSHNNINIDNLARLTRQSTMFDTVFLPENPSDWPATTMEAIKSRMGEAIVTQLQEGYTKRQEELAKLSEEERAKAKQNQGMFQMLMRAQVQQELNSAANIEWASDGLPPEIALRVNGKEIKVEDVYREISGNLNPDQVLDARRWLLKCALLEAALGKAGKLLSEEEFAPLYEAHVHPAEASFLPMEQIVRGFMKFPSMDSYRQYYRLLLSYERMIADEITDQNLQGHFERRGNRMLNLATVDAQVILCSAFDFENNRWKDDGWNQAADHALRVVDELAAAEGANWDQVLEANSQFWDPPTPTQATMQSAPKQKNKGRLGPLNRNEMLQELSESDYRIFLEGQSLTDEIFFNLEEGAIGGPYAGPYGYYIVRILSHGAPSGARSLADVNFREMLRQDYLSTRFVAFARTLDDSVEGQ